jgi:nucleotide-binding universal stress UspA family protein
MINTWYRRMARGRHDLGRWILAVSVGEGVGFAIATSVAILIIVVGIDGPARLALVIVGGAFEGAALALGQYLGMREGRPVAWQWIAATALAAAIAWTLGMMPSTVGMDLSEPVALVALGFGGIVLLASIPVAQWLVLQRPGTFRWVPVNAGAWAVAILWTFAPSPFIDEHSPLGLVAATFVVAGVLMAVTFASLTAGVARSLFFPRRDAHGRPPRSGDVGPAPGGRPSLPPGPTGWCPGGEQRRTIMNNTWYRSVVVGVDGSDESLAALNWATLAADLHGARLTVVAAHPVPPEAGPGMSSLIEDAHEQARHAARAARERLGGWRPGGRDVETRVLPGNAARVLAEQSTNDDLVVVGRRGLGAFDRVLLGSTSSALAAAARGTVAVVPSGAAADEPRRIRVGVGPVDEPDVLGTAFAEADARGCPLEVLHVTGTDPISSGLLDMDPVAASWHEAAATDLADRLARWSDKYPKVTYSVVVRRGDRVTTLLQGLAPNDILVVGGHSHSVVTGRLLRSVPDAVVRGAPCSVLVVHAHRHLVV